MVEQVEALRDNDDRWENMGYEVRDALCDHALADLRRESAASPPAAEGTPRTDAAQSNAPVEATYAETEAWEFARQLERELQAERQRCEEEHARLIAALDEFARLMERAEQADAAPARAEKDARRLEWLNTREGRAFMVTRNIDYTDWRGRIDMQMQKDAARGEAGT